MSAAGRYDAFRELARRRGRPGELLLESLPKTRSTTGDSPGAWAPGVAARAGLPAASGFGPASYYADLAAPHGRRHVRVCTATACFAAQGGRHVGEVEGALGVTAPS